MVHRLGIFGLIAAGSLGLASCGRQSPPPQMAPDVGIVVIKAQPVTLTVELPGRTVPYTISSVIPQVSGVIKARLFTEGSIVKAGQPLYQIDPRPYQAALDQAKGQLARDQANLVNARLDLTRYQTLLAQNSISQQVRDTQVALVSSDEGTVKSDLANVEAAQINLDYTKITAPISGRIGASSVTAGAFVAAYLTTPLPNQATSLATIQTLDPIYVDIDQSSDELLALEREAQKGHVDRTAPLTARVTLEFSDGSAYPLDGSLQFTDITVDQSTGAVLLRALFPNPDGLLLPGLYVRATVIEGVDPQGILVPQQGVSHNEKGEPTALIVDDKNIARLRVLKTGRAIGGMWQVLDGLKPGDRMVVVGLQKVVPDMPVHPLPAPPAQTTQ